MSLNTVSLQSQKEVPFVGPVPDPWKWHVTRISELFERLAKCSSPSEEYTATRKQLFSQTAQLYRQCTSDVPAAFDDDICYSRAEEVAKKELFSQYPGSEMRLLPLATNYLDCFSHFNQSIVKQSADVLSVLNDLAKKHYDFLMQYSAEIKQVKGNDGRVVAVTHEKEVRQGTFAYLDAIVEHPYSTFAQMTQKIEESDPEAILLLPNLIIFYLIDNQQQPIPYFLTKYASEIKTLRDKVSEIPSDEMTKINHALFGKDVKLEANALEILGKIQEIGFNCQRGEQAEQAAGFLDALLASIARTQGCLAYTFNAINQHKAIITENYKTFSKLSPFRQTIFFWLVSDQPFTQPVFPKNIQSDFLSVKERYKQLSTEQRSSFIKDVLEKKESKDSAIRRLMRDLDYFENKLAFLDDWGLLLMQTRVALHYSDIHSE